jgi:hypothetical protein
MKLFIPTIGTTLRLKKAWTFTLYWEHRNLVAGEKLGLEIIPRDFSSSDWERRYYDKFDDASVTLPRDTVLKVERIYIRNGAGEFDSLTFRVVSSSNENIVDRKGKHGIRFWAKLPDCNLIDCEVV